MERAIEEMSKKATRNDVPGDILTVERKWCQTNKATINIHETAQLLNDFSDVTITSVQKKQKATKSSENPTISHNEHTANVVARILTRRIEKKTKEYIQKEHFRFRRE